MEQITLKIATLLAASAAFLRAVIQLARICIEHHARKRGRLDEGLREGSDQDNSAAQISKSTDNRTTADSSQPCKPPKAVLH